jgi:sec-independent protein translocase protein TatA
MPEILFIFASYYQSITLMALSILLGMVGGWQIAIIVLVILLLFGGKKIPELMKGIGRGVKEFKDGISGEDQKSESREKDQPK